jgi:hypothetical protein
MFTGSPVERWPAEYWTKRPCTKVGTITPRANAPRKK